MRLASALTDAGGNCNEDAFGFIERDGAIEAAWVIDGVTGINERNFLPATTDALWFVDRVQLHLHQLAGRALPLSEVLHKLTTNVIDDWNHAAKHLIVPEGYDLPACCLMLVQKSEQGWQALRLGDSFLLSKSDALHHHAAPPSNLGDLELNLKAEAKKRRSTGRYDFKDMLIEFRPQLMGNRKSRNKAGGYSILEPKLASLNMPQYMELGWPNEILLCTDGFYRCVDHYSQHDDASLLAACNTQSGAESVLNAMRKLEDDDPECQTYLRFKPRDDATVLMLRATID